MTQEVCALVAEILLPLGFAHDGDGWNMIAMTKHCGAVGDVVVWGRDWSALYIQLTQGDENTITLAETRDLAVLKAVVNQAIAFLAALPNPA